VKPPEYEKVYLLLCVKYKLEHRMVYISLVRGINVSGQKKIQMKDLKFLYESLNFEEVATYIQSGNVIFSSSETDASELAQRIENAINNKFGYEVFVILRSRDELEQAIENNPFIKRKDIDTSKLYVTFLKKLPADSKKDDFERIKKDSEEYDLVRKELYLYLPEGYGRTKLTNTYIERKLKVNATTRNWRTVNKLLEMAN
ncbi:MAG: DUF1697 domain-containing protein, partial [Calditrichaceae bacterium]